MSKMSTDLQRHALNGPTMGTRWSAVVHLPQDADPAALQAALQQAVDRVDAQMSTWNPQSDLMRLDAAPLDTWLPLPAELAAVLRLGLAIGRASAGAFDIAQGDAVRAWGFGPAPADPQAIRASLAAPRSPAHERLELAGDALCKYAPVTLDLNGIAKGYGVDRLAKVLREYGLSDGLVGIDGEMRALGLRPDGSPWTIAIEAPERERRSPHAMLALQDAAVATSGDYRHWVSLGGRDLSHTMDPARGAPLTQAPASVTVIAPTCAEADAWATALMVRGVKAGAELARKTGLDALFLTRNDDGRLQATPVGRLFTAAPSPTAQPLGA